VIKLNRSGFGLTQAALFVSVLERLDFAVPPPELYIMAIDKLFAHSIGLFVIGANQFYCPDKMTVRTNGCRLDTLPSTARREPGSAKGQCEQYCTPSKQTQHNFAVSVHPPPVQCVLVFPAISLSQASAPPGFCSFSTGPLHGSSVDSASRYFGSTTLFDEPSGAACMPGGDCP
jgi:hypothetical protein